MSFYCYLLYTDAGQTYVGATVDVARRLRQHKRKISGGARATGMRVDQGLDWKGHVIFKEYLSGVLHYK
jgi:predicted GIY-YIG superfamily endonuclease